MKPYDVDIRQALIAALDQGMSLRAAARLHGIDPSTASRWRKRLQRQGALAAAPHSGRRALLRGYEAWLAEFILLHPGATPGDVHAALLRIGAVASYATVRRFMIGQGAVTPVARSLREGAAQTGK